MTRPGLYLGPCDLESIPEATIPICKIHNTSDLLDFLMSHTCPILSSRILDLESISVAITLLRKIYQI